MTFAWGAFLLFVPVQICLCLAFTISPQGGKFPEQVTRAKNWLQVKNFDGSFPSACAGEPPCLLLAPESFVSPWAPDRLCAAFVFTQLRQTRSFSTRSCLVEDISTCVIWLTAARRAEWGGGCENRHVLRSWRLHLYILHMEGDAAAQQTTWLLASPIS